MNCGKSILHYKWLQYIYHYYIAVMLFVSSEMSTKSELKWKDDLQIFKYIIIQTCFIFRSSVKKIGDWEHKENRGREIRKFRIK